jgi:kynurenine formamidase
MSAIRGSVRVVDLTHEVSEDMPIVGSYPRTQIKEIGGFSEIAPTMSKKKLRWSVCELRLIDHAGTHVDAPLHIRADGEPIDVFEPSHFIRMATVLRVRGKRPGEEIDAEDLSIGLRDSGSRIRRGEVVLIHTGWDRYWGKPMYFRNPGISMDAAKWLADKQVSIVGTDTPNIDPGRKPSVANEPRPGHFYLLAEKKILHMESICGLDRIRDSRVLFIALPLKIRNGTGSPVRAVALEGVELGETRSR